MKKKISKIIPKFKNEDDERDFWATADATEYFNADKQVDMDFSNLKPSTESISLRLPSHMLRGIKEIANSRDVPLSVVYEDFFVRTNRKRTPCQALC